MKKNILFFATLVFIPGIHAEWKNERNNLLSVKTADSFLDKKSRFSFFKKKAMKSPLELYNSLQEKSVIAPQFFMNLPIQNSFIHEIQNRGRSIYQSSRRFTSPIEASMGLQALSLSEQKQKIKEKLAALYPFLQQASWVSAPELEISVEGAQPQLVWVLDAIDSSESKSTRYRFNQKLKLKEQELLSSCFFNTTEALGRVYPEGPNKGPLREDWFQVEEGLFMLSGPRHFVVDASKGAAQSKELRFLYESHDPRFDQVQSYYYAYRFIEDLKKRLDIEPLRKLQIKVRVGNKSNTAFYYSHRIRLGEGDGVRYNKLLHDPSIIAHEVAHALVHRYASLPTQGEGGSLNEAFADYFAASHLDNPKMGEASLLDKTRIRDLENTFNQEHLSEGLYKASQVVSGTLWDFRKRFGRDNADKIALATLKRLGPGGNFENFPTSLRQAAVMILSLEELPQLNYILQERGWNNIDESF